MSLDRVIIGRTLSCLLFSWRTQTRCLLLTPLEFYEFDEQYDGFDFSEFNANTPTELITNLCFAMSYSGLLLQPNNVQNIREEDGKIVVITNGARKVVYDAKPMYFEGELTKEYIVYDEFHWRAGTSHVFKEIRTGERFCNRIIFYSSRRRDVTSSVKDFIVVSKFSEDDLHNPDYGNGIIKVAAKRIMKERGIKGKFSREWRGTRYYKSIKADFSKRVVMPIRKQTMTFREVFETKQIEGEAWKTFQKIRG